MVCLVCSRDVVLLSSGLCHECWNLFPEPVQPMAPSVRLKLGIICCDRCDGAATSYSFTKDVDVLWLCDFCEVPAVERVNLGRSCVEADRLRAVPRCRCKRLAIQFYKHRFCCQVCLPQTKHVIRKAIKTLQTIFLLGQKMDKHTRKSLTALLKPLVVNPTTVYRPQGQSSCEYCKWMFHTFLVLCPRCDDSRCSWKRWALPQRLARASDKIIRLFFFNPRLHLYEQFTSFTSEHRQMIRATVAYSLIRFVKSL